MMRGILRSIAGLALLALVVAARPAMAAPLEQLKALASQGAAVSVRVVDLNDGRTLAAMNAGVALTPASVSKLYTAAAALEQWGADYRFTTRVLYTGEIHAGELRGRLGRDGPQHHRAASLGLGVRVTGGQTGGPAKNAGWTRRPPS